MSSAKIDPAPPRAGMRVWAGPLALVAVPLLALVGVVVPGVLGIAVALGLVAAALAVGVWLAHRRWTVVVLGIAVLGVVPRWWSASRPDEPFRWWIASWTVLGLALAVWAGWTVASAAAREWNRRSLAFAGALTAVLLGTLLAVQVDAPMAARFALSRGAFDDAAVRYAGAPVDDLGAVADSPMRLGLYRVQRVAPISGGLAFFVTDGIVEEQGFFRVPDGQGMDGLRNLGGGWYAGKLGSP